MPTKKTAVSAVVEATLAHSKTDENKLTTHLRAIERCGETVKKSLFEICVRLNAINTEKLYEIGGYKNTAEWAAHELGYARSTTLNYIKIAERFLEVVPGKCGKFSVKSICARCDNTGAVISDYKIGQLNAAGRATADDFVTMDSEGVISPEMSADAIKRAVKTWYDGDEQDEQDEQNEQDEQDEQDDITAEYAEKMRQAREMLWWLENNAFSDDLKNRCHAAAAALQGE